MAYAASESASFVSRECSRSGALYLRAGGKIAVRGWRAKLRRENCVRIAPDGIAIGIATALRGGGAPHLLNLEVRRRRAALDAVGGHRVRRADEAEHRRLAVDLAAQRAERLADKGARGVGVDQVHRVDGGLRADRRHLRPRLLEDVEVDAHPRQRRQDVGEEDDAVGLVRVPRLQRDLGRHLGDLGALAEGGVLLAQVAVHLHVPPRLAHHPHRRPLHRLAARRAEQQRVAAVRHFDVRIRRRQRLASVIHHRPTRRLQAIGE
jgi:hypothetical protein